MPKVSIVLPVHNARETLRECLGSIRSQTLGRFEVVVIDDGSTDGSPDVVSDCFGGDGRLRLMRSDRVGLVAALNLGVRSSRSEFIARMDADDRMHPERLRLQLEYLERRPDTVLVGSTVRLFGRGIRTGYREYVAWQNSVVSPAEIASEIYVESPLAHPSVMMRRRVIEKVGGYRHGPFPEDYELWLRMHSLGLGMAKLERTLLEWRDRPDRTSRTDTRYSRNAFDRLRARYLAADPRIDDSRPLVIWGAGRRTRQRARHFIDRGRRLSAWIDIDPRKVGRPVWDVPVEPPEWLRETATRPFVLIYIARHGAREEVSDFLEQSGYRKGDDFLAVG